jgi:hypothetical protein
LALVEAKLQMDKQADWWDHRSGYVMRRDRTRSQQDSVVGNVGGMKCLRPFFAVPPIPDASTSVSEFELMASRRLLKSPSLDFHGPELT